MLVLTVKPGQSVTIGEGPNRVDVMVTESRGGGAVALGFTAPRSIPIVRWNAKNDSPPGPGPSGGEGNDTAQSKGV